MIRVFRVIRVIRLIKVIRVFRVSRVQGLGFRVCGLGSGASRGATHKNSNPSQAQST